VKFIRPHRLLWHCCYYGRLSHIDVPPEPRAVFHDDTVAKNIAFDFGGGGLHGAFTNYVAGKAPVAYPLGAGTVY